MAIIEIKNGHALEFFLTRHIDNIKHDLAEKAGKFVYSELVKNGTAPLPPVISSKGATVLVNSSEERIKTDKRSMEEVHQKLKTIAQDGTIEGTINTLGEV